MATQKKEVYKQKVKQKGYLNYIDVYNLAYDWLKDHNYKLKEKLYTEKLQPNGKEIILNWEAYKKVTDYFKNVIQIKWHILGMKDAEIEINGKKVATNKGEVGMEFKAELHKDYEKRWEDKPIWKFLRSLYEKYIIRTTVDQYEDDVEDDAKEMIKDVKAFLQLGGR